MDWKSVVGTVAPWLATALGGPLAGSAVTAIGSVFGLGATAGTSDIAAAITGATPEQLAALRAADQDYQLKMQAAGFGHIEQLAAIGMQEDKIDADDRDSARKRQEALRDRTPAAMAWLIIGSSVALAAATIMGWSTKVRGQAGAVGVVLGYVFSEAKSVLAYYFGSSQGSDRKTELLAQSTPVTPDAGGAD